MAEVAKCNREGRIGEIFTSTSYFAHCSYSLIGHFLRPGASPTGHSRQPGPQTGQTPATVAALGALKASRHCRPPMLAVRRRSPSRTIADARLRRGDRHQRQRPLRRARSPIQAAGRRLKETAVVFAVGGAHRREAGPRQRISPPFVNFRPIGDAPHRALTRAWMCRKCAAPEKRSRRQTTLLLLLAGRPDPVAREPGAGELW